MKESLQLMNNVCWINTQAINLVGRKEIKFLISLIDSCSEEPLLQQQNLKIKIRIVNLLKQLTETELGVYLSKQKLIMECF